MRTLTNPQKPRTTSNYESGTLAVEKTLTSAKSSSHAQKRAVLTFLYVHLSNRKCTVNYYKFGYPPSQDASHHHYYYMFRIEGLQKSNLHLPRLHPGKGFPTQIIHDKLLDQLQNWVIPKIGFFSPKMDVLFFFGKPYEQMDDDLGGKNKNPLFLGLHHQVAIQAHKLDPAPKRLQTAADDVAAIVKPMERWASGDDEQPYFQGMFVVCTPIPTWAPGKWEIPTNKPYIV